MRLLTAVLLPLCVVLALLALEDRHMTAAWRAVQTRAGPTAEVAWRAAGEGLGRAVARGRSLLVALPERVRLTPPKLPETGLWRGEAATASTAPLRGRFTAEGPGGRPGEGVEFVRAEVRFGSEGAVQTEPHRIRLGRDLAAEGRRWSEVLGARADEQLEVRRVASGAAHTLCGGDPVGWLALLRRGDRVVLAGVRAGAAPGEALSPDALCPARSFRR